MPRRSGARAVRRTRRRRAALRTARRDRDVRSGATSSTCSHPIGVNATARGTRAAGSSVLYRGRGPAWRLRLRERPPGRFFASRRFRPTGPRRLERELREVRLACMLGTTSALSRLEHAVRVDLAFESIEERRACWRGAGLRIGCSGPRGVSGGPAPQRSFCGRQHANPSWGACEPHSELADLDRRDPSVADTTLPQRLDSGDRYLRMARGTSGVPRRPHSGRISFAVVSGP
jgi:hypothetical protein